MNSIIIRNYNPFNTELNHRGFKIYSFIVILLAISYGITLSSLPIIEFLDRNNYLNYAQNSYMVFDRFLNLGFFSVIENEPIWLTINIALSYFFSPEETLRVIIFFSSFTLAWIILSIDSRKLFWLFIILLFPAVLKNNIIHLRQGLALSVFLMGWFSNNRVWKILLLSMTPFIHASYFFVLLFLIITSYIKQLRIDFNLVCLLFFLVGVLIVIIANIILPSLSFRQVMVYNLSEVYVSGFGFIFWLLILGLMYVQGRSFIKHYAFEVGTLIFYLSSYFFMVISARIFESTEALVLISGLYLTHWRRSLYLFLIIFHTLIYYFIQINKPWLGFGV